MKPFGRHDGDRSFPSEKRCTSRHHESTWPVRPARHQHWDGLDESLRAGVGLCLTIGNVVRQALGISPRTAKYYWTHARAWSYREIGGAKT